MLRDEILERIRPWETRRVIDTMETIRFIFNEVSSGEFEPISCFLNRTRKEGGASVVLRVDPNN